MIKFKRSLTRFIREFNNDIWNKLFIIIEDKFKKKIS
jgi:hypothetical protein